MPWRRNESETRESNIFQGWLNDFFSFLLLTLSLCDVSLPVSPFLFSHSRRQRLLLVLRDFFHYDSLLPAGKILTVYFLCLSLLLLLLLLIRSTRLIHSCMKRQQSLLDNWFPISFSWDCIWQTHVTDTFFSCCINNNIDSQAWVHIK